MSADQYFDKKVVNLIRGVRGNTLRLKVERGDHVVPNIQVNSQYSGEFPIFRPIFPIFKEVYLNI